MRILCFLHSFEPGGVECTALRLCARWQEQGLDVAVMLGRAVGRMRRDAPALAYHVAPQPGFSVAWIETLWMILWLPGVIRRERPDILFCPGNSYTIVAVAMRLLLGRRCPPIAAKLSNDLSRPDMAWPIRLVYHAWCRIQGRAIDRWIALSPAMADEAAGLLRVARADLVTIANPILDAGREQALQAAGAASRASRGPGRRFVAAGRLVTQKGFDRLIAAFAQAAGPHDRLRIVGEGPMRAPLQRRVAALGLAGRVDMPGHQRDIAAVFADSDILLLSSLYEGLPGVVVEAMAAEIAVVATDCCASMRDLLPPAAGTLVPAGCAASLRRAVAAAAPRVAGSNADLVAAFRVERVAQSYQRLFAKLCVTDRVAVASPIAGKAV